MNEIFLSLGIESWKPTLTALLLPPLPLMLMVLIGARLLFRRRLLGWMLILTGVLSLWLLSTPLGAIGLRNWLLPPQRALMEAEIGDLKRAPKTAIVVLGGGRRLLAPEYGMSTLQPRTVERLRFGLWLARETSLPVLFSGGTGHGAEPGASEAEIAARVAEREFGRPLRWTEGESRDTHENALRSVKLLQQQGIEHIVLVTEAYHMPRALRNFQHAAEGHKISVLAAPMGLHVNARVRASDLLPDPGSAEDTWLVLHEFFGRLAGA